MVPDFLTLREVLARLPCGRTFLLGHLARHPMYGGAPTHRRIAGRIVFTEPDLARLMETFAPCLSASSSAPEAPRSTFAAPSAEREFARAMALATKGLRKKAKKE
jgi:hypothetical protein